MRFLVEFLGEFSGDFSGKFVASLFLILESYSLGKILFHGKLPLYESFYFRKTIILGKFYFKKYAVLEKFLV